MTKVLPMYLNDLDLNVRLHGLSFRNRWMAFCLLSPVLFSRWAVVVTRQQMMSFICVTVKFRPLNIAVSVVSHGFDCRCCRDVGSPGSVQLMMKFPVSHMSRSNDCFGNYDFILYSTILETIQLINMKPGVGCILLSNFLWRWNIVSRW